MAFHSFARLFLPWLGVSELGKNMVNVLATLETALNATGDAVSAQQTEIESLRKTSAQYKYVLGVLFVKERGLCAILNDSCCSYADQSKRIETVIH
ncbi:ERVV2 protein, partial [Tricholaema leucomelas]|nr:ERVV2 protein [Tricholaema leucomelas]